MNITYSHGDLLKAFQRGDIPAFAHVCNCQGVMGSGIALSIKQQYPEAYSAYTDKLYWSQEAKDTLGDISFAHYESTNQYIFNLHAQLKYGIHERHLNYEALYTALVKMRNVMVDKKINSLGIPHKMGSDRAGGDFDIVIAMIKSAFKNTDINIVVVYLQLIN